MTPDGASRLPDAPPTRPRVLPTWQDAWAEALYGERGFYRRPEGPAGHFRTACHAAPVLLAEAVAALARSAGCATVVDVGAGRGELLTALAAAAPDLALHGLDVVDRPPALPGPVGWSVGLDRLGEVLRAAPEVAGRPRGVLVTAWELLDVVPCPILEVDDAGVPRTVHVDPLDGRERLGAPVGEHLLAWCRAWWPVAGAEPGARVEVGLPRDAAWSGLVRRVRDSGRPGLLVAVDYAHLRETGRPVGGTLAAFRAGRPVPPVPDGSCDLTAHVALDAVAAAGGLVTGAGAPDDGTAGCRLTTQRDALRRLGIATPPGGLAPGPELLARLARASAVTELTDPGGLGGFGWLLQAVGSALPEPFA